MYAVHLDMEGVPFKVSKTKVTYPNISELNTASVTTKEDSFIVWVNARDEVTAEARALKIFAQWITKYPKA